jgi:hypothetical protein
MGCSASEILLTFDRLKPALQRFHDPRYCGWGPLACFDFAGLGLGILTPVEAPRALATSWFRSGTFRGTGGFVVLRGEVIGGGCWQHITIAIRRGSRLCVDP